MINLSQVPDKLVFWRLEVYECYHALIGRFSVVVNNSLRA